MPFKQESSLYDLFHKDKDYAAEAMAIKKRYRGVKTILEIGSGTGLLTIELIKLGFKVTVLEPSEDMLEQMWKKYGKIGFLWSRLEDIEIDRFKKDSFDLVLANYDVINYIKHEDQDYQLYKLSTWGKRVNIEMWDATMGVKFFTHKKVDGWHRFRIGIKIGRTAHLWFIYLGKGFLVEKHTLYL